MQLKSISGEVIFEAEATSVKELVERAVCLDVYLCDVDLAGEDLEGAYLCLANFRGAYLANTNFSAASLTGANFEYAFLNGANFTGAELQDVYLKGACLKGTNWTNATVKLLTK